MPMYFIALMIGLLCSFIKENEGGASPKKMKKLYVGNLPYSYNDQKLAEIFSEFGEVISAVVIIDRARNRSKGFGFVEMNDADADAAMETLNNKEIDGRVLKISEARPMNNDRRG